tara:strand:- start:243 stop:1298 length:1056 start_codon:yes stop_codon:yes gene_type:complete
MRLIALSLLTLLALPHPAQATPDFEKLNSALTDSFVIPGYAKLAAKTTALSGVTKRHCAAPTPASLQDVKRGFADAMTAWQEIAIISFGPITENARAARVQFWPDKRGTAARQIRRVLLKKEKSLLAPGGLTGKSVALQNLTTFERLLTSAPDAPFPCGLMAAIAAFQADQARATLEDWRKPGGFRQSVVTAKQGNRHFTAATGPATAFLKSIATLLDIVIRYKLETPLGDSIGNAAPKSAETWRTGLSRRNIAANLDAIAALFTIPGGFTDRMAEQNSRALAEAIVRLLGDAAGRTRELNLPLSEAVTDADERKKVQEILRNLQDIRILIRESVVNTLNLPIGFNSLDGD